MDHLLDKVSDVSDVKMGLNKLIEDFAQNTQEDTILPVAPTINLPSTGTFLVEEIASMTAETHDATLTAENPVELNASIERNKKMLMVLLEKVQEQFS